MDTGVALVIATAVLVGVTLWYAYGTHQLAQAAKRQADANARMAEASAKMAEEMRRQRLSVSQPVVVLKPLRVDKLPSQHNVRLTVTNVGNGPAIKVRRTVSHPSLKVSGNAKEHTQPWPVLLVEEEQDMSFVLSDPVEAAAGMLEVSWLDIHGQQFSFSAPIKTERSGQIELGDVTFKVGKPDEAS